MKASQAVIELQKIMAEHGDVELLVDTEAGKFPCHCVSIDKFYATPDPEDEKGFRKFCLVTLDPEVMQRVHPPSWKTKLKFAKSIIASGDKNIPAWVTEVLKIEENKSCEECGVSCGAICRNCLEENGYPEWQPKE